MDFSQKEMITSFREHIHQVFLGPDGSQILSIVLLLDFWGLRKTVF